MQLIDINTFEFNSKFNKFNNKTSIIHEIKKKICIIGKMLFQQYLGDVALKTWTDASTMLLDNQAIVMQLSDVGKTLYFCYGQCYRVLSKTYIGTQHWLMSPKTL